jgi:TRAP-type C4-dicarboxylate transport system permease small subunit
MFRFLNEKLARLAAVMSISCLAVMTVSILVNVFFRYVLNAPLSWPPELARFMMVSVTLFASSLAIRNNAHVGVSLLVLRLPLRVQTVIYTLNSILISGFLLILLWYGGSLAFDEGPRQTAPSLGVSMMFAFIPLPVGAALMLIQLWETTVQVWQRAAIGIAPFETAVDEAAMAEGSD